MRLGLGRSKGEVNEKVEGTLSDAFLKSACFNLSVFFSSFSSTPFAPGRPQQNFLILFLIFVLRLLLFSYISIWCAA